MCDKAEFEVCRLCLSSRGLLMNVFGENSKLQFMLEKTIEDLIDVKVVQDANYPWLVCSACMEKLTEFRLFKRRCAECLSVFYDRIQKECYPATKDWIPNREEFPGEIKKETDDDGIASDAVDSSAVDVQDDMIFVKEETDTASGCSVVPEKDVDLPMVASMTVIVGDSHWSSNGGTGNLDRLETGELHVFSNEEVNIKEEYDIDGPQGEENLGGEVFQVQDDHGRENINELQNHSSADTSERPFKCEVCWKAFTGKTILRRHILTHTSEKPYKCSVCYKGFSQIGNLKRHTLTHTGKKQYKCQICSKAFVQNGAVKVHMLTHTGERSHRCELCSKAFPQKGHLQMHMKTHTGEKQYKCNLCSKAFVLSGGLKRHILTHTGEKSFKCERCPKAFTRKHHLERHSLTHSIERH